MKKFIKQNKMYIIITMVALLAITVVLLPESSTFAKFISGDEYIAKQVAESSSFTLESNILAVASDTSDTSETATAKISTTSTAVYFNVGYLLTNTVVNSTNQTKVAGQTIATGESSILHYTVEVINGELIGEDENLTESTKTESTAGSITTNTYELTLENSTNVSLLSEYYMAATMIDYSSEAGMTVTVSSTAPYTKTLTRTWVHSSVVENDVYTIENYDYYVKLTLITNDEVYPTKVYFDEANLLIDSTDDMMVNNVKDDDDGKSYLDFVEYAEAEGDDGVITSNNGIKANSIYVFYFYKEQPEENASQITYAEISNAILKVTDDDIYEITLSAAATSEDD